MADVGRIGECNDCHMAVRYVVSVMGSILPLDVNPNPSGMVAMVPTPNGARAKIFGGSKGLPPEDGPTWMDHRTVCARRQQARAVERQQRGPSQSERRCRGCMLPLDRVLAESGDLFHPCCSGHPHHEAPTYIHRPVPNGYMDQVDCAVCQSPWPCSESGQDLKAAGQALALDAADEDWTAAARRAIKWLAAQGRPFTSEDVTARTGLPSGAPGTNRNNAVGALMTSAAKAGLIAKTGERVPSQRPTSHGAEIAQWVGAR
jgi:hypothetical protein